ncbi:hypothetical protein ACJX0J_018306, partial [Zea mays]
RIRFIFIEKKFLRKIDETRTHKFNASDAHWSKVEMQNIFLKKYENNKSHVT